MGEIEVTSDLLEPVLRETREVAAAFAAAGHRVYVVGGMVRDLHLGRFDLDAEADLDLTTDATPTQVKAIIGPMAAALWTQGERFGTIGAKISGRAYEITTHRSEEYERDSRKPEVRFPTALEADLARRDFTVNAMAIELPDGTVVDPHGGAADLAAGVLRTPLDPRVSFGDDPLRMLRAARFRAGYGLAPDPALLEAMTAMAERLEIVSAERVRDELDKLLSLPTPSLGLTLLAETGVLAKVLPWSASPQRSWEVLDALPPSPVLRLAALTIDAETPTVGARLRRLRHSRERVNVTASIVASVRLLLAGTIDSPSTFRRWWLATDGHADDVRLIAAAVDPDGERAVARSVELERALAPELSDLGPPIDATAVMVELDLVPGPEVGAALAYLTELRLDHGSIDEAEARRLLRVWWAGRA